MSEAKGGVELIAEDSDVCGLCGETGADKFPHTTYWPGEQRPESELVHAECEQEECRRAHAELSDEQRRQLIRSISLYG